MDRGADAQDPTPKHSGEDRAMFYLVMAQTGFRRREAET
jgi:hypothetical protein